jgi:hypothetical protein
LEGLVTSFPLIGPWTIWKVGNGKKVRIGEDPWLGAGEAFYHLDSLVWSLHGVDILSLVDSKAQYPKELGRRECKSKLDLGLSRIESNGTTMLEIFSLTLLDW